MVGDLFALLAMTRILPQLERILHGERTGCHSRLRRGVGAAWLVWVLWLSLGGNARAAQPLPEASGSAPAASAVAAKPKWIAVPRISGRITRRELGLVINSADPYSVEVGEFYARERGLAPAQLLRVELPVRAALTPAELKALADQINSHFGATIEALALAWTLPYAVNCNSITGALALGYDDALCARSCAPSRLSPMFNAPSARPYTELRLRPSMLLAARDVETAKALIRRGVAADHSLGFRGAPPVHAHYVVTPDATRSVRAAQFPPPGLNARAGIEVHVDTGAAIGQADRVLLYMTGLPRVEQLDKVSWVPGALADHLTSFGGQLDEKGSQMSVLAWIASGATASYGTVSEPCAHVQKFPHPQVLLLNYAQGSSAIEAYWRSVAWPQQGVFVGEPLAAPFARP
jgi:uncharacterized protein (TIGR03790 family)